ncbi:TniQ family protein [Dethiobacter alkaliphilus]|uniref:TniQ family protein n=1 Tax=Dethiobacter alkaliphilus TaxID=427926 RepID=UPI0022270EA2|nr:TniQ family protein [Dethiobacter alkaliphilus]MCW3491340.1 TniQ family protein [Dethiobacter alkaliphilus]
MTQIKFLIRPCLQKGESLSSFIQRTAEMNGIHPYDIWRLFRYADKNPQVDYSHQINSFPINIFNLQKFANSIGVEPCEMEATTFMPVIRKYTTNELVLSSSLRFLNGMLSNYLKFCPACLRSNPYYRLIWQIAELKCCHEHKKAFIEKCPGCGKKIPVLRANSIVGLCPWCGSNLCNSLETAFQIDDQQNRIFEDWDYLLSCDNPQITVINGSFDEGQFLAIKLLYIMSGSNDNLSFNKLHPCDLNKTRVDTLIQIARDSCTKQKNIHLSTVLTTLRSVRISLIDFTKITPPEAFINSLLDKSQTMSKQYSCRAPWCTSYNKPGSLQRTGTSTKRRSDGTHLNYFLYCACCGIEYAIVHGTGHLVERGYFIQLAWGKVKQLSTPGTSISEIAILANSTNDKVLRCVIFLYANGLISKPTNIQVPDKPDLATLYQYFNCSAKEVWQQLHLSYNEHLFYSFLPETRLLKLRNLQKNRLSDAENEELLSRLKDAIKLLSKNNEPISLKSVCKALNMHPKTLKARGFYHYITEARQEQRENLLLQKSVDLKQSADTVVKELENNDIKVTNSLVYELLGVNRTSVNRTMPEVIEHITGTVKCAKIRQKPIYKSK